MRFEVMINEAKLKSKEECIKFTGAIKNNRAKGYRTNICTVNEEELATFIEAGHTVIPAILDEEKPLCSEFFKQQQIFFLDFDNGKKDIQFTGNMYLTFEDIISICEQNKILPMLIYETFSSNEQWKKYRVVFAVKEPILDERHRESFLNALIAIFAVNSTITVDSSCTEASRIFYPAQKILYVEPNCVDSDEVIKIGNEKVSEHALRKPLRTFEFSLPHKKDIKPFSLCGNQNIKLIKSADIRGLQCLVDSKTTETIFESEEECIEYITNSVDIADFLGVDASKGFYCVLHDDEAGNSPSASIFITRRNEQFYKCHSDNCSFKGGNIIRIVEYLQNCSRPKAIRFIKKIYNLKVEESEWVKEQKLILDENIRMLVSGELNEVEPEITSIMWRYIEELVIVNSIAKNNVVTAFFKDDNENAIFYLSQKHLAKVLNKSYNSKKLPFFTFLKLCKRIPDEEVPQILRERAIEEATKNGTADTIQFYSIPSYSHNALSESRERSKQWKSKGYTMKGMSREMIYRGSGEEVANEVYPKRRGVAPSKESNEFKCKFESYLIQKVSKYGYALEKDIAKKLDGWTDFNETKIKRVIAESLQILSLKRIRVNKENRAMYHVPGKYKSGCYIIVGNCDNI